MLLDVGDSSMNHFEEGGNNKDQGVDQVDETKYSRDPLHGIRGLMTRRGQKE